MPEVKVPGSAAFKGKKPGEFVRETWVEITQKTTWPTRPELIKSTTVVLAAIGLVTLYLAACDIIMARIAAYLLG